MLVRWINNMTEIEIRGKLDKIDFDRLFELLQEEGKLLERLIKKKQGRLPHFLSVKPVLFYKYQHY